MNASNVDVNDRVLELSTGPTSRPATGAEREQNSAESAQIAAVHQQEDLNKRMDTARAQLNEAQIRVAAARHRLLLARQLVLKVQNGETVHLPATPATTKADDTPAPHHSAPRRRHAQHDSAPSVAQDPRLKTYRLALQDAQRAYLEVEKQLQGSASDAVLVSVDSVAALQKAYPNYFLDTRVFIALVRDVLDRRRPAPLWKTYSMKPEQSKPTVLRSSIPLGLQQIPFVGP